MVVSDWDGEMTGFNWVGVRADIPTALAHLLVILDVRNYNSLGLGPGDDVIGKTRFLLAREFEEDVDITKQILSCIPAIASQSLCHIVQSE